MKEKRNIVQKTALLPPFSLLLVRETNPTSDGGEEHQGEDHEGGGTREMVGARYQTWIWEDAVENGNKKATSLQYQPFYHCFPSLCIPFFFHFISLPPPPLSRCLSLSPLYFPFCPLSFSFVSSVFAFILVGHCVHFTTQQNGSSLRFALFCGTPRREFSRRGIPR